MISIIKYFRRALTTSPLIKERFVGGIWATVRPEVDDEADIRPYIIISYMGARPADMTKDDRCPRLATPVVNVTVAADSTEELADLVEMVEERIRTYSNEEYNHDDDLHDTMPFYVDDIDPSEGEAFYDDLRPCHAIILTYSCDTTPKHA